MWSANHKSAWTECLHIYDISYTPPHPPPPQQISVYITAAWPQWNAASPMACMSLVDKSVYVCSDTFELPHAPVTPQPHHRCHDVNVAVACHSTLHTLVTVTVLKWQPVNNANESWLTISHLPSKPFPIATAISSAVISMDVHILHCFIHGGVYSKQFLTFNTGQFVSSFLNQKAQRSLPFCQLPSGIHAGQYTCAYMHAGKLTQTHACMH